MNNTFDWNRFRKVVKKDFCNLCGEQRHGGAGEGQFVHRVPQTKARAGTAPARAY